MNRRRGQGIARERHMMFGVVMCVSLALALVPVTGSASQTEDDGSSYTDPDFGWSIAWDPEVWANYGVSETVANEDGATGNEVIIGGVESQELGVVFVGSHPSFGGDLGACVETLLAEVGTVIGVSVSDVQEADLELPEAPDGAERTLSSAQLGEGMVVDGVVYVECRPLVEDEAVLGIRWVLPLAEAYEEMLPAFEDLIAGLELDGAGSGDDEASDESDQDAEEASDATTDANETETYTDPTYGWSITWDPAVWEGQEPGITMGEDDKEGHQFDLWGEDLALGGVTVASLPSPTLANDLAACVDFVRPRTLDELEGDGAYVENLRELDLDLPEAPSDAVRTLFAWDSGPDDIQISYIECRTLVEDEVVLIIEWTLPVGEPHEEHLPTFEELMSGLDLSEAHSE